MLGIADELQGCNSGVKLKLALTVHQPDEVKHRDIAILWMTMSLISNVSIRNAWVPTLRDLGGRERPFYGDQPTYKEEQKFALDNSIEAQPFAASVL